ncbi:helix-turn-helix transcriptional regulator [Sporosarcina sp. Marseille-Q4063]|uniref:AraC family transcriptional regulator n=1 Tax=Sporosarcina sp. Marseille-Q4063 TaxID=2810514 RepID=UPI001BAE59DD|nr:AraC family transcriptional regulator [Sporosarcina sp. Marseille-Q4063]QUW21481.1 helix-turn-helix transcriptional regulator [Sporosarcina sp. Marseille-Q4063]
MLSNFHSLQQGTFGFRFKESHQQRIAGINSLGWEKQFDSSYDWNGLTRSEKDIIIFQYTLKGGGEINIQNHIYQLEAGDAFFVKVPSEHRYYLPSDSTEWEFLHITLFGKEALRIYEDIVDEVGHILKLDLYSMPISIILDVLGKVSKNKMNDAFEASSFAYSFLMAINRNILNIKSDEEWPEPISNAIVFINNNFHAPITLDDIVRASGLSKYHFTRLFSKSINSTPIQYLTNIRINASIDLLKNKNLTIDEIAVKVGFSNGNYFGKVFRSYLDISPGEYRNTKSFNTVDHLIGYH